LPEYKLLYGFILDLGVLNTFIIFFLIHNRDMYISNLFFGKGAKPEYLITQVTRSGYPAQFLPFALSFGRGFFIYRFFLVFLYFSIISVLLTGCGSSKTMKMTTLPKEKELMVVKTKEDFSLLNVDLDKILAKTDPSRDELNSKDFFLPPLKIHTGRINVIEEVLSSRKIFTGGQDGKIFEAKVRYDSNGKPSVQVDLLASGSRPILALSASPDGRYLAVSQFSQISIINLETRKIDSRLNRVKGRILSMAWGINSRLLLLGRANGDVFSWNLGEDISRSADTTNVLEFYETTPSPVVSIVFHPSGRAFFVALQSGSIYLIRLVRTERELGLRLDLNNQGLKEGKYVVRVGRVPSTVNDMILDSKTEELLVSCADGSVYRWRLRGLRKALPYPTGSDSTGFISLVHPSYGGEVSKFLFGQNSDLEDKDTGENLESDTHKAEVLLLTLGRNLRLRFWCTSEEVYERITPTSAILYQDEIGDDTTSGLRLKSSEDDIIDQLRRDLLAEIKEPEKSDNTKEAPLSGLVSETAPFLETVIAGKYSKSSGIIWVGEKTGVLIGFDVLGFLSSNSMKSQVKNVCKKVP
jgi:WD40 repeat protein